MQLLGNGVIGTYVVSLVTEDILRGEGSTSALFKLKPDIVLAKAAPSSSSSGDTGPLEW